MLKLSPHGSRICRGEGGRAAVAAAVVANHVVWQLRRRRWVGGGEGRALSCPPPAPRPTIPAAFVFVPAPKLSGGVGMHC